MASVKYGAGIIQMSGSLAGNVYARNRSGNYVRARTKPTNPNSARQVKVRAALSALTERWADVLTGAQRTAWNLYASSVTMLNKLGESIHLSGFNHYIRSNMWALDLGIAPVDAGPTTFELPGTDPAFSVAVSEATQIVTMTFDDTLPWEDENGALLCVLEGSPQNPQVNFFGGPYKGRIAKQSTGVDTVPSPQEAACLHVLTEGQRVWYRARIRRADGRLSNPFYADCIVAA